MGWSIFLNLMRTVTLIKAMLFRFSGKPVNEAELRDETEIQFSKILLNLGLQCSNRNYTVLHFKGISFLTAYLAIPVITLYLSHKELQLEKIIKWAELTQESKYFCGIR